MHRHVVSSRFFVPLFLRLCCCRVYYLAASTTESLLLRPRGRPVTRVAADRGRIDPVTVLSSSSSARDRALRLLLLLLLVMVFALVVMLIECLSMLVVGRWSRGGRGREGERMRVREGERGRERQRHAGKWGERGGEREEGGNTGRYGATRGQGRDQR